MSTYDINVFLIKDNINDFDEVLKEENNDFVSYQIRENFKINGKLYLGENKTNTPDWNTFLSEGIIDYEEQSTMSTRAVLFIKRQKRIFAFAFGYGRHMLRNDSYVRGFGLKVILNNARDGSLKSVDTSIFDETPFNSTLQTSKSVLLSEFNITDIRTMFRAVTAESNNEDRYGGVISGKDSFNFSYAINFANIKSTCDCLLEDYNNDSYKERFPEIDRIEEVSDPAKIDQLDTMLIQQIRDKKVNHFYIPELVEWELVEGFSFTPKGIKNFDLSINRFREEKRNFEQRLSVDYLNRHKIHCVYNDEGIKKESWPVYHCLHTEIQERDTVYFFSIGQWFKVEEDFINKTDAFIEDIKECPLEFPEIDGEHEKEANEIIVGALPDTLNLDRNNAYLGRSKYEVCDLLTKCKRFIHVKWWDSSATLSHLFSQGRVSADILLNLHAQRKEIFNKITEQNKTFSSVINADKYNASEYTIVYAIIYPENETIVDRLPFFSKANLRHNVSLIQNMGYNVELAHIRTSRERLKKS